MQHVTELPAHRTAALHRQLSDGRPECARSPLMVCRNDYACATSQGAKLILKDQTSLRYAPVATVSETDTYTEASQRAANEYFTSQTGIQWTGEC